MPTARGAEGPSGIPVDAPPIRVHASGAVPLSPACFGIRPAISPIALLVRRIEMAENNTNQMLLRMTASFSVCPAVSERHTSLRKS
jgi:hypothetical protein